VISLISDVDNDFTFLASTLAESSSGGRVYSVIREKVENYWLRAGRAHDVIMLKIYEPIAPATTQISSN
jgi:hypothetical protein